MKKKKVLLIMPISTLEFGTKNAGGVDSVCQEILKQIIKVGSEDFEYRALAFDPFSEVDYSGVPQQLANNVSVVTAPANEKLGYVRLPGLLCQMIRIRQQIKDYQPDIIHSHASSWLAGVNKRHHRIATLHAYKWIGRQKVSPLNDFLYVKILPRITNFFIDQYTCVGNIIKDALEKNTTKPIYLIENPINEVFFAKHHRPISTSINLVTCSIISPRKRLDRVISLVSDLVGRNIDVQLCIIGPASNISYYEQLIRQIRESKLEGRVSFLGRKNTFDVANIYKNSDFGVFLSDEETFGLAPLEMLASGLPIIATPVGILSEERVFFSEKGIHYYDNDTNVDSVIDFINFHNKHFEKIPYSYLKERFTPSSIVAMYENLYTDSRQQDKRGLEDS
ncbi:VpsD family glycosyltransferase [Pseudomonas lactis]|uniref:VpsD family glycosyltransferase n=1 Tax=Pseudomonas lactis TaxID=1615674 RepID=UPI000691DFEB|nr:VpsD family glycosyltransferase [Pseudomonas lactis]